MMIPTGGTALLHQQYPITFITPVAIHGANSKETQFRIASVKGIYRYWWRTLQASSANLLEAETAFFGGTMTAHKQKSPVTISFQAEKILATTKTNVRPHDAKGVRVESFQENQQVTIQLSTKKQVDISLYEHYANYMFHVGGFGQRARRGFGSCQLDRHNWQTIEEYVKSLQQVFEALEKDMDFEWSTQSGCIVKRKKKVAIQHPIIENIYIGQGKKTAQEVLFAIGQASHEGNPNGVLGKAKGGRWASPLHCTVRKIGDLFYPIITEVTPLGATNQSRYEQQRATFLQYVGVQL